MHSSSSRLIPALRRWVAWRLNVAKAAAGPHGVLRRRLGFAKPALLEVDGTCPICGPRAHFVAEDPWLRDHFLCVRCASIPRERALMAAIEMYRPNWRDLAIHESSPGFRGVSPLLRRRAAKYSCSYFDETRPLGTALPELCAQNQNIEAMTFPDNSFDVFITQDVFEHLFDPSSAIREISRVLKPNGILFMTVPLVNRHQPSCRRAERHGDQIIHLKEAEYHGDPISPEGALVVTDWGFDIGQQLADASGMSVKIVDLDDLRRGIRAQFNEVIVAENHRADSIEATRHGVG
jgi:SAM-dependent methyltransferase